MKSNDLAGTNLVIAGSGTEVVLASEEKLAQMDKSVVFDQGSVTTANGQIDAPIPTRLATTVVAAVSPNTDTTLATGNMADTGSGTALGSARRFAHSQL